MIRGLDSHTRLFIRLSAAIAGSGEAEVRLALRDCRDSADPEKTEEVILQSHLFCGFPRALNAARAWRRISERGAPLEPASATPAEGWRERGERTCALVYGDAYRKLRNNVRALHPELDEWMIVEGYGRVLSREQLDLKTRELCIVAACAASRQERQLHSHLHGALNVGATAQEIDDAMECMEGLLEATTLGRTRSLWEKVRQARSI